MSIVAPLVLTPFSHHSADAIFDLLLPIQQQEFGISVSRADQGDLENIPLFYQTGLGNFWIALDRNLIIGTIALKDIGNRQVALRKMFVHGHHRGAVKGVAKALLATALDWARQKNIRDIFLGTTDKFLAAHRFYEKNGFVEIAKNTLPSSFPLMAVDSKFYHYNCSQAGF